MLIYSLFLVNYLISPISYFIPIYFLYDDQMIFKDIVDIIKLI